MSVGRKAGRIGFELACRAGFDEMIYLFLHQSIVFPYKSLQALEADQGHFRVGALTHWNIGKGGIDILARGIREHLIVDDPATGNVDIPQGLENPP